MTKQCNTVMEIASEELVFETTRYPTSRTHLGYDGLRRHCQSDRVREEIEAMTKYGMPSLATGATILALVLGSGAVTAQPAGGSGGFGWGPGMMMGPGMMGMGGF